MDKETFDIEMQQQNNSSGFDVHQNLRRTGTIWTASSLIVTSIVGSGILSLAWTIAQLGWIGGPLTLFFFAFVATCTSLLLSQCCPSVDLVNGSRDTCTYMDAVRSNLGDFKFKTCALILCKKLFGVAIIFTIASSKSTMVIQKTICVRNSGGADPCHVSPIPHIVGFGIVQLVLFQVHGFNNLRWLPVVSGILSFTYSLIGIGLAITEIAITEKIHGSLTGIRIGGATITKTQKIWRILQSFGNIAFAYSHPVALIEIQETIKSPPSETNKMRKANFISYGFVTILYMLCGCSGYAAFGDSTPGNILTSLDFHTSYFLPEIANVAIVVHLVITYQTFCQTLFAFTENDENQNLGGNFITNVEFNTKRLVLRLIFVIITTVVSIVVFPSFSGMVGLIGALGFWPLTVYFPIEMYIAQVRVPKWRAKWICLQLLSFVCLVISIAAAAGSVAELARDLKSSKPFKTKY